MDNNTVQIEVDGLKDIQLSSQKDEISILYIGKQILQAHQQYCFDSYYFIKQIPSKQVLMISPIQANDIDVQIKQWSQNQIGQRIKFKITPKKRIMKNQKIAKIQIFGKVKQVIYQSAKKSNQRKSL